MKHSFWCLVTQWGVGVLGGSSHWIVCLVSAHPHPLSSAKREGNARLIRWIEVVSVKSLKISNIPIFVVSKLGGGIYLGNIHVYTQYFPVHISMVFSMSSIVHRCRWSRAGGSAGDASRGWAATLWWPVAGRLSCKMLQTWELGVFF